MQDALRVVSVDNLPRLCLIKRRLYGVPDPPETQECNFRSIYLKLLYYFDLEHLRKQKNFTHEKWKKTGRIQQKLACVVVATLRRQLKCLRLIMLLIYSMWHYLDTCVRPIQWEFHILNISSPVSLLHFLCDASFTNFNFSVYDLPHVILDILHQQKTRGALSCLEFPAFPALVRDVTIRHTKHSWQWEVLLLAIGRLYNNSQRE